MYGTTWLLVLVWDPWRVSCRWWCRPASLSSCCHSHSSLSPPSHSPSLSAGIVSPHPPDSCMSSFKAFRCSFLRLSFGSRALVRIPHTCPRRSSASSFGIVDLLATSSTLAIWCPAGDILCGNWCKVKTHSQHFILHVSTYAYISTGRNHALNN